MIAVSLPMANPHWQIYHCDKQFRVVNAGRRFGKTLLAIAEIIRAVSTKYTDAVGTVLKPIVFYAAPTQTQAKEIMWDRLLNALGSSVKATNVATLTIKLKSGAMIRLGGSKNWNSFRGKYCCLFIVDEFAFCEKPEDFKNAVLPMLATPVPAGRVLYLSTPDGKNHFYENYMKEKEDPARWKSFHFSSLDGKLTTEAFIEDLRSSFTPTKFRQEFFGEFINPTGLVYYAFSRDVHVIDGNYYPKKHHDLHWAWDFNVNPACHSTISYIRPDNTVIVVDEIAIGNTPDNLKEFMAKYPPRHFARLYLYGDCTGNRNTSGKTDYIVMLETLRSNGYDVHLKATKSNPAVRDRTENVNRILLDSLGNKKLFVLSKCGLLINDFEKVKRTVNSGIDKASDADLSHISDAIGYQLWVTHPPRITQQKPAKELNVA